jgi:hypothetical protein
MNTHSSIEFFCLGNPCCNGVCNNFLNSYNCSCFESYSGMNCDKFDACFSNPCCNGVCFSENNEYTCECDPEYTGRNCDEKIINETTVHIDDPSTTPIEQDTTECDDTTTAVDDVTTECEDETTIAGAGSTPVAESSTPMVAVIVSTTSL